jgi:hypothetical protein
MTTEQGAAAPRDENLALLDLVRALRGARPGSAAAVAQNNASADDDLYSAVMGVVQGGNPLS